MYSNVHVVNSTIMAEVLLVEHLFAHFLPKRDKYPIWLMMSCTVCLLAAFWFPVDGSAIDIPYGTFMYLSLFCLAGAGLVPCYKENGWSILFCAITGYTVHQLASALNEMLRYFSLPLHDAVIYFVTFGAATILCYCSFSKSIKKAGTIWIDKKKLLVLSAFVLLVDVVLGLICGLFGQQGAPTNCLILLAFYNSLCCVFVLCILFNLLANKRMELEMAVMTQLLEEEKKQYQMSRDNIEIINMKCHDLKHQIRKLRTDSVGVSPEALQEIEDAVGIYDSVAQTGNDVLDVILTEKSLICEQAGIHLTCIADGEKINFISPSDIYALFGNALDNAIEAVSQLEDSERRNISLHIQAQGRLLSIHVENYFSGKLDFKDDLPQTSKGDKIYHGFGMKSMRMIAERYGGYLTSEDHSEIFHLNIVIPIPQTART